MIILKDRTLLNDGSSVVSEDKALRMLLSCGKLPDFIKVKESEYTQKYKEKYGENIGIKEMKDVDLKPEMYYTDRDEMNMMKAMSNSTRCNSDNPKYINRFIKELEYFTNYNHIGLLCVLHKLILNFKKDDVVWGVGRGSSCASYLLYLLEVHDIDPVKNDIKFSEFSKEKKYD